jgi:SAM-dependent methyltransferase
MQLDNPGAIIENTLRSRMLRNHLEENRGGQVLLDLGCGTRPYRSIYHPFFEKTIGAELPDTPFPQAGIDLYCHATSVPLPDSSIDFILCTEVLHDLPEPDLFFNEIKRLLKPGGTLFLTSPFVVPLVDGHYDHYRYTEYGLRHVIHKSGLTIDRIYPVGDIFASALTLFIKPPLKAINAICKFIGLPRAYSSFNPFIFLIAVIPQICYLILLNAPGFRTLFKRFNYGPLGYVSIVRKPT